MEIKTKYNVNDSVIDKITGKECKIQKIVIDTEIVSDLDSTTIRYRCMIGTELLWRHEADLMAVGTAEFTIANEQIRFKNMLIIYTNGLNTRIDQLLTDNKRGFISAKERDLNDLRAELLEEIVDQILELRAKI